MSTSIDYDALFRDIGETYRNGAPIEAKTSREREIVEYQRRMADAYAILGVETIRAIHEDGNPDVVALSTALVMCSVSSLHNMIDRIHPKDQDRVRALVTDIFSRNMSEGADIIQTKTAITDKPN